MLDYKFGIVNVHDGDTVELVVDLGFKLTKTDRFRLDGINAPELPTPAGIASRDYLKAMLAGLVQAGVDLRLRTTKAAGSDKQEKYGRYLATLVVVDATGVVTFNVNDDMVKSGHAVYKQYLNLDDPPDLKDRVVRRDDELDAEVFGQGDE